MVALSNGKLSWAVILTLILNLAWGVFSYGRMVQKQEDMQNTMIKSEALLDARLRRIENMLDSGRIPVLVGPMGIERGGGR